MLIASNIQKFRFGLKYDANFYKIVKDFLWITHNKKIYKQNNKKLSDIVVDTTRFYLDVHTYDDNQQPMEKTYNILAVLPTSNLSKVQYIYENKEMINRQNEMSITNIIYDSISQFQIIMERFINGDKSKYE